MRKDGSPPTVDLKLIEGKVDDIFKKQNIWLFSFFWSFFCSGDFLSKQMKTRVYHLGEEALYLPIRGLSPCWELVNQLTQNFPAARAPYCAVHFNFLAVQLHLAPRP